MFSAAFYVFINNDFFEAGGGDGVGRILLSILLKGSP